MTPEFDVFMASMPAIDACVDWTGSKGNREYGRIRTGGETYLVTHLVLEGRTWKEES